MKPSISLSLTLICLCYSQNSFSGSVNDNFAKGDTLTAQHLNNIKQAINDNQAQVTDNNQAILLNTSTVSKVNTSTISNAKKITGNSKVITGINFSILNLQPKLPESACDGFSYVQGFDASGGVICSTDALGTGYTRTSPVYQDNTIGLEIDGVAINNPVLLISGVGYDTERIESFDASGRKTFDPGFSHEHDFVIETDGDDANNLIAYFDDPSTDKRAMAFNVTTRDGLTIVTRVELFEFSHHSYATSIAGRTRFTFVQSTPPKTPTYNIALINPFGFESAFNPATDTRVEINGVSHNDFYPQVTVDLTKKTLTLTHESNEGGGIAQWVETIVQGNSDKRSMSVIQEINGIETSRKNYFEVFPIMWEIYDGFALDTKLKARIVLSFDFEEDG